MCGFLLHQSKFFVKDIHEKHLIKWAAIYTIDACKLPKVFRDHEQYLYSSSSINQNADEIEKMRVAGRLAAEVLDMIKPHIKAGVNT
jgi:hypothetical protein